MRPSHAHVSLQPMPAVSMLIGRIIALALLFTIEAVIASVVLDGGVPAPTGAWFVTAIHRAGPDIAKFGIAFCAIVTTFAALRYQSAMTGIAMRPLETPIRWPRLMAHFAAMGVFAAASTIVYGKGFTASAAHVSAVVWVCATVCAVISAALALVPWQVWMEIRRATNHLWVYAAVSSLVVVTATNASRSLWVPASRLTFRMVRILVSPFLHNLLLQPERLRIGTTRFAAIISPECSGLEGVGLLLVFGCMWLLLFRHEARFPHALILLPLGAVTLFFLNSFRIAALILIGNAGAPEVAARGFHSQAGWILFNSVAFGCCVLARRWRFVSADGPDDAIPQAGANATAAFLMPFLTILAAGMLARATSSGFEWFYPLRVIAASVALWHFRDVYRNLNWRCDWKGLATGLAVYAIWSGADQMQSGIATAMPHPLADATAAARVCWVAFRIAGAVMIVPIAEELAFRGFLLRRFVSADFEGVVFSSTTAFAVISSSVLFGAMHGSYWMPGIIAGLAYAAVARSTGSLGNAVAAHAVTNGLIAIEVLTFGHWQLW